MYFPSICIEKLNKYDNYIFYIIGGRNGINIWKTLYLLKNTYFRNLETNSKMIINTDIVSMYYTSANNEISISSIL